MKTSDLAQLALYEATRPRDPSRLEPRVEIHMDAPNAADSARLFGELKDKAEKSITDVIRVTDTHFECVVHKYLDAVNDEQALRAIYTVNGSKMETIVRASRHEDWMKVFERLRDKVAKDLARKILAAAFAKTMRP